MDCDLSLTLIIRENEKNSKMDYLNVLLSNLSYIQTFLLTGYISEIILKSKLLNWVKHLEEYRLSYQKPASTIYVVISDFYPALETSKNSIAASSEMDCHLL